MAEISPSAVPGDEHFYRYLQVQKSEDAAKFAAMGATKAALEQTAFMTFLIEAADNKDYRVLVNSPHAFTINSIATKSGSGTCTLTAKINSTALGGAANSVSTSEVTQTHSSANDVAIGDDVVLTVSSNSGAEDVSITIACTLTLDA